MRNELRDMKTKDAQQKMISHLQAERAGLTGAQGHEDPVDGALADNTGMAAHGPDVFAAFPGTGGALGAYATDSLFEGSTAATPFEEWKMAHRVWTPAGPAGALHADPEVVMATRAGFDAGMTSSKHALRQVQNRSKQLASRTRSF